MGTTSGTSSTVAVISLAASVTTIVDQTLIGNAGSDSLVGGLGNDQIYGNGGNDTLNGGPGNDSIDGGGDNDSLYGGIGADRFTLQGSDLIDGYSSVEGDALDLTRLGNNDRVKFINPTGILDLMNNSTASFLVDASTILPAITVIGAGGSDTFQGGKSNDYFEAFAGSDNLDGGSGNDTLLGGVGNDTLLGGVGNDTLIGGLGNDSFDFTHIMHQTMSGVNIAETDRILDFSLGDRINLSTAILGLNILPLDGASLLRSEANLSAGQMLIGDVSEGGKVIKGPGNEVSAFVETIAMVLIGLDDNPGTDLIIEMPGVSSKNLMLSEDKLTLSLVRSFTPTIQFGSISSSEFEGNSGKTTVNVPVVLSTEFSQSVTVPIAYSGTATSGADYNNVTTQVTIPAGQKTGSARFDVLGDTGVAPDETVILSLGTPINAVLGANTKFTHTILNDDGTRSPSPGNDSLIGTTRSDTIDGSAGNDTIRGEAGDDSLRGGGDEDAIYGGDGDDTLVGGTGNDELYGGNGSDTATYLDDFQLYRVTEVDESRNGGPLAYQVDGPEGTDTISADIEYLMFGSQIYELPLNVTPTIAITSNKAFISVGETATISFVLSAPSTDFIPTDVTVSGGTLSNFAGSGRNYTATFAPSASSSDNGSVSVASNKFSNAAGNFNTDGADANNSVALKIVNLAAGLPTIGPDLLAGSQGSDTIDGLDGSDTILGKAGDDLLIGGAGIDELQGDEGADTLVGGRGNDRLFGGPGSDVAIFSGPYLGYRVASLYNGKDVPPSDNDAPLYEGKKDALSGYQVLGLDGTDIVNTDIEFLIFESARYELKDGSVIPLNPQPTIAITSSKALINVDETVTVSFTVSAPTTDFVLPDITVSGGVLSNFSGSGTKYIATFTPSGDGSVNGVISVANGKFSDGTGSFNADGRDADNVITIVVSPPTLRGTNGADSLTGFTSSDTIYGLAGFDTIRGAAGNDYIAGGVGEDVLYGDTGDDRLTGGIGSDTLVGGDGLDTAAFAENRSLYTVVKGAPNNIFVGMNGAGTDGLDLLVGVEYLRFSDSTMPASKADSLIEYAAQYPDLASAFGTNEGLLLSHYVKYGWSEGRVIVYDALRNSAFDPLSYIASYPGLITTFGTNTDAAKLHYIQFGYKEGRKVTFDPLSYVASYPDLIAAFGTNTEAASLHYIQFGHKEGRRVTFDPLAYVASYSDLIEAFGTNTEIASLHYIEAGYREGRKVTFDPEFYLSKFSDLRAVFNRDFEAATKDFINAEYSKGRVVSNAGDDVLEGSEYSDNLTAGAGSDVITGGRGADVLSGGIGSDRFIFTPGSSGQTNDYDVITDFAHQWQKAGVYFKSGDVIDFSTDLVVGGTSVEATSSQASVNQNTGVVSFANGSGMTISDALSDITSRFSASTDAEGEFAVFQINNSGDYFVFISDGFAGVTPNDVVIRLVAISEISSSNLDNGDLTLYD